MAPRAALGLLPDPSLLLGLPCWATRSSRVKPTPARGRKPFPACKPRVRRVGQHDRWPFWEVLGPPALGWPRGTAILYTLLWVLVPREHPLRASERCA